MIHHLQSTLERLEALLDGAIEAMTNHRPFDDASHAGAKGRTLLALNRLSAEIPPSDLPAELQDGIRRVRGKLAREQYLLRTRLDASQLVVRLIGEALLANGSDGTYGPRPQRSGLGTSQP